MRICALGLATQFFYYANRRVGNRDMVTAYRIAETKDQRTDDFNAVTSRAWRDEVV